MMITKKTIEFTFNVPKYTKKFFVKAKQYGIGQTLIIAKKKLQQNYLTMKDNKIYETVPFSKSLSDVRKNETQPGKIAIHLHLYYEDLLEELVKYFVNMPFSFDLYVTTKIESNIKNVEERTLKILANSKLESLCIEPLSNKGRDILALCKILERRYNNYKYICHVHSKKSLFTGYTQDEWRTYLFDSLFKSPELILTIFGLFDEDKIGLVYPTTFLKMPYWAHSWLSNRKSATELGLRLGIAFDLSKYVDYPVGSMFWAKTDAIKPLFKANFQESDFPPEPIPNDGTLSHALERSFCEIAKKQGYSFAEIDITQNSYTVNTGKKNLDQYWRRSSFDLWESLRTFKAISFDIFDTLITRPLLNPDHIFYLIEKQIKKELKLSIDYYKYRKEAESSLRQENNFGDNVTIDRIYSQFKELTGLTNEIVNRIKDIEIHYEILLSLPRKDVINIPRELKSLGKKVVFLSDMYLTSEIIKKIFQKHNVDLSDIDVLVSSEICKRKDTNEIWASYMHKIAQIHVGDNEHSDVQLPVDNKIMTYHVMSPVRLLELANPRVDKLPQNPTAYDSMYLGPASARLFSSPFRLHPSGKLRIDEPEELGYSFFGPIILYFTVWLFIKIQEHRINTILFFAREGFLLKKMFDLLDRKLGQSKVETKYLLCSRRGVSVPAIFVKEHIYELLDRDYKGPLSNLLESRFGLVNIEEILDDRELSKIYKLPQDKKEVSQIIKKLETIILNIAKVERENYIEYLKTFGILEKDNIAVVDIGYFGTIQKSLSRLTKKDYHGFYFVTGLGPNAKELQQKIFGCFGNYLSGYENNYFYNYSLILESILIAQEGQFIHFNKENGAIHPVFGKYSEPKNWPVISKIQNGIMKYFSDVLNWFGDNIIDDLPQIQSVEYFYKILCEFPEILGTSLQNSLKIDDYYVNNGQLNAFYNFRYIPEHLIFSKKSVFRAEDKSSFNDKTEFDTYFSNLGKIYMDRLLFEKNFSLSVEKDEKWQYNGYCDCCEQHLDMIGDWALSEFSCNYDAYIFDASKYSRWYERVPLFRETLVCPKCRLNNRQRGIFFVLKNLEIEVGRQDIYVYEQITPFYSELTKKGKQVFGSEYLGKDYTRGMIYGKVRHEDAHCLTFESGSFDLLISNDVFEHVYDLNQTLREAYRVLRKNGILLLSVPFDISRITTYKRAKIMNDSIQHILPPIYHGNPVSKNGSLVYYDFGWDIIDIIKSNGFGKAFMQYYYAPNHALIGGGLQFIFVAKK